MVLKEAFRMQNKLDELLNTCNLYLLSSRQNMTTKEIHQKHKANPNATDEEIILPKETDYDTNQLMDFAMDLINEKDKLYLAINEIKKELSINVDSSLAMNRVKQDFAKTLEYLTKIKPTETKDECKDYLIDNEGKQSPYYYNTIIVRTIDFDRDKARKLGKKLSRETDQISAKVDKINVTVNVEYTPKYYFDDSFDDALSTFLS